MKMTSNRFKIMQKQKIIESMDLRFVVLIVMSLMPSSENLLLRLVTKTVKRHYGILEYNTGDGLWKTFCGRLWSDMNSQLACKKLGFNDGRHSMNMMNLFGVIYTLPDTRIVHCQADDYYFEECFQKNHTSNTNCETDSFVPVYLVCTSGNAENINFISSSVSDNILSYRKSDRNFLVLGSSWTKWHDKLAAYQLGQGQCHHDLIPVATEQNLTKLRCPYDAKSLDECEAVLRRGKSFLRLTCFTSYDLLLSDFGYVTYREVRHEITNFSLTLEFEEPTDIIFNVNFKDFIPKCQYLNILPAFEDVPINYFEKTSEIDVERIGVSYFSIKYVSQCEIKNPFQSHFEIIFTESLHRGQISFSEFQAEYVLPLLGVSVLFLLYQYRKTRTHKVFPRSSYKYFMR